LQEDEAVRNESSRLKGLRGGGGGAKQET
jgi:hypothetical protein